MSTAPSGNPADSYRRRAMLVEDDAFTRALLAEVITGAGFEVRECTSAREASRAFDEFDPDVLVVDIQLEQPPNGAQLAQALHARAPYLGIVVVSQYPSPEAARITSGLPPGAAFVHKGEVDSSKVVLRAIESVLSDDLAPVRQTASAEPGAIARCSANQVDLLRMIALGYSNERIAHERGTGVRAVEQLIHRTYARLGLPGDAGANARVLAVREYVAAFGMPTPET
jgi:DNA-binding NarL/FixJ family response regulator